MIDWLAIVIALVIITALVGGFGFLAWKINMSDPLVRDDNQQTTESGNEKRRKEKNTTEQSKKKRKDQKKSKRENKSEEEEGQTQRNKPLQTSEETDDEREESEQELLTAPVETVDTSSKARKRNKNKPRTATPPPPSSSKTPSESNTKTLTSTRAPQATHSKPTSKDELESTKQQTQVQTSNKQTLPTPVSTATTTKKPTQNVQNQEQPFQVVGGNRHKTATPPVQQQQQQNKPQVNVASPVVPVQQASTTPVQQEQLAQRQVLPPKETPAPVPVKQTPVVAVQPKISDLIKALPSSQAVVSELMSALDAFSLSSDELGIIMHKIANKQSVLNQDWNRLHQGQKVDPQAQIGQVLDQSAREFEDDVKNNAMKRIKDITDELNAEKRRNNDLLKEKNDKERQVQMLHAQLDSIQHRTDPSAISPPQPKLQALELQLKRITEENKMLTHQLSQQQLTASNLNTTTTTTTDASNMQVQVLSEQIKKLSVTNTNLEKKVQSNELLTKEAQKEKENLVRYNEQLTQSVQNVEEKYQKQLNEIRTAHVNEMNEYQNRVRQLENDNEQLKREEIVHVEPSTATDIQTITINNEEREQLENEIEQLKTRIASNEQRERELNDVKRKSSEEIEEYQKKIEQFQSQRQLQESEFERLKQEKNDQQRHVDESHNNELNTLRVELNEVKSTLSQSEERLREEHDKQRQHLADLLPQDLRNQLPNSNQDFNQWFSSYRQLSDSNKRNLQEENEALKRENAKINQNMTEIENQLKDVENIVQSKEETLLMELKSKDALVENLRAEKEQISHELQRVRHDILNLQSIHDASVSEARALKLQLDERSLVATNTPSILAADESFELVKQPSPSLSPIVVDIRAEQLNELIRSSKEALDNQDSVTQQLDKHLNDMHNTGLGETSANKTDDDSNTVSSSSNEQS